MKLLVAFAVMIAVLSVTVSCYAKAFSNARCNLCGVEYDSRIQYHGDCFNDPKWRGVAKALAKTNLPKSATLEDLLKRQQQLDASYRAKFPGQPEETYPKFQLR